MMARLLRAAVFMILILSAGSVFAACHAVTPYGSGSKSGADWNNAYAGLPPTLTRGDIYYLADGTYASFTFSTAASGTTTIEFRKAQSYDNCTSTGWNTSTMGSAQAVFHRGISIAGSYFILNGNGTSTGPGCGGAPGATVSAAPPNPTDCGIQINDSTCTSNCIGVVSTSSGPFTFEYVEFLGNSTPGANEDNFVFGGGFQPSTYNHIYGHNTAAVYLQYGCNSRLVENSYWWGTEVAGVAADGTHGQYSYCDGSDSNGIEVGNVYRDIKGTAIYTFGISGTHSGWEFYDNVYWWSSSPSVDPLSGTVWSPYLSDGLIACINSVSNCNSFAFVQNTIINGQSSPNLSANGINNENTGGYLVENNLWYVMGYQTTFNSGSGGVYTQEYNSFLNDAGCVSGTANVCDGSYSSQTAPNPFTNWKVGNFTLASENADWNNRIALGAPYDRDAAGNPFTTDRGAYQYVGAGALVPPTNLKAAVQ